MFLFEGRALRVIDRQVQSAYVRIIRGVGRHVGQTRSFAASWIRGGNHHGNDFRSPRLGEVWVSAAVNVIFDVAVDAGLLGMRFVGRFVPEDPRQVGHEPDYRFTLANERTFLAWVRTALALTAGGLGVISLLPNLVGSEILGLMLLSLSFATAATAYRRWANNEAAMRLGETLPASRLPQLMAASTATVALVAVVIFVVEQL